jgi:SAM-dependent methyltransferase
VNDIDLIAQAPSIAALMAAAHVSPAAQRTQTAHRAALVAAMTVPTGASVLELGCGQGDLTAVLAEAVGPGGRVVAVDIADPSYGAPVTLGRSAEHLKASRLGARIDFRFGVDVLDGSVDFPGEAFDHVVLAALLGPAGGGRTLRGHGPTPGRGLGDASTLLLAAQERMAALPAPVRDLVLSQADVLRAVARKRGNTPLPSYSVTAR